MSSVEDSFGTLSQQQQVKLEGRTACGYGADLVLSLFRCQFCDLSFINLFVLFNSQACNVAKRCHKGPVNQWEKYGYGASPLMSICCVGAY